MIAVLPAGVLLLATLTAAPGAARFSAVGLASVPLTLVGATTALLLVLRL